MKALLQVRVADLKQEFAVGQSKLREIENQQAQLRETLLRIGGAIQVLEELLADSALKSEAEVLPMERR